VVPAASAASIITAAGLSLPPDGIGPHVTLLYPFVDPDRLDDRVTDGLRELFAEHGDFDFQLTALGRFPGVNWLRPEPAEPFANLLGGVRRLHPQQLPYGGAFEETIFHVTVSTGPAPGPEVGAALGRHLPVSDHAREVWLLVRSGRGAWCRQATFPLATRGR
jgi:hypothetical protein